MKAITALTFQCIKHADGLASAIVISFARMQLNPRVDMKNGGCAGENILCIFRFNYKRVLVFADKIIFIGDLE